MPSEHPSNPKADELQDPIDSARAAGLHHVGDDQPGIRRERRGKGFLFRNAAGRVVRDPKTVRRIQSLAIPPAWIDVWICPDANGHLQATGRDDRGRKQFRYHPRWREVRDENKYARMIALARALPRIRSRVRSDLAHPGLPREKVLATVVRLLEVSLIRVGNDEYARDNDSFGLTTMRDRHVRVNGTRLCFSFRGKSGRRHEVDVLDRRLARIVKNCQDLPGQELFQYLDSDGQRQDVKSGDVNGYLREIAGQEFTAKDFRTWAGTVLAGVALREFEKFETKGEARKNILRAIESVAKRLGNTPTICRKCYIHPHVLDSYLDGTLARTLRKKVEHKLAAGLSGLRPEEGAVLGLLQQRLTVEEKLSRSLAKEAGGHSGKRGNGGASRRSALLRRRKPLRASN